MNGDLAAVEPIRMRDLAAALGRLRWPHVRAALLFGIGATAFSAWVNIIPIRQILTVQTPAALFGSLFLEQEIFAFVLLAALTMADEAVGRGAHWFASYAAAAIGGCVISVVLAESFGIAWRTWLNPGDAWPWQRPYMTGAAGVAYFFGYTLLYWLLLGGFATFFYATRRADRQTAVRLYAAEIERLRQSKAVFESRLQAMQARVEPQFLFRTLERVETLYASDAVRGERLLADLISYLRAAMPAMRSATSTVAREIELVVHYAHAVDVRAAAPEPRGAGASALGAPMPAMILLPLVDDAIGRVPQCGGDLTSMVVESAREARTIRVAIAFDGPRVDATPGSGVAGVRERLDALWGQRARLDWVSATPGHVEATLHYPLEDGEDAPPRV